MSANAARHAECWLLLPWLANGRLSAADRSAVEDHVRECAECAREVAWQRALCQTLAEPDRVSYAPGPSLRKLFERIDGRRDADAVRTAPRARRSEAPARAFWRPLGLSWAAGIVLVVGLAGLLAPAAYRWSQPLYATRTTSVAPTPGVLHIAFQRSLTIGEVEGLLHSAGARVVEGPDATGIFGVAPVAATPSAAAGQHGVSPQMRALAARLRTDTRVRWVEPEP
jgi:Putative zinc-finger